MSNIKSGDQQHPQYAANGVIAVTCIRTGRDDHICTVKLVTKCFTVCFVGGMEPNLSANLITSSQEHSANKLLTITDCGSAILIIQHMIYIFIG